MKSIFDKTKFKNKDKVSTLRQEFSDKKIFIDQFPKDVLVELFQLAVLRIVRDRYGDESFSQLYFKDLWWEQEYAIDQLFEELEERVKLDIYA